MGTCLSGIPRCAAQGLARDPGAGPQAGEGDPPWGSVEAGGGGGSFQASLWLGPGIERVPQLSRPTWQERGAGPFDLLAGRELADAWHCQEQDLTGGA